MSSQIPAQPLIWRPTKIMNVHDLSKDDDFLSHLLVEKLGAGSVPLLVHKMDPSRKLPKTNAQDLLNIVRRLVISKAPLQHATRQAVDNLLLLPPIHYYLKDYTQQQINAFATHASRYFELYHPSGSIEIAHTSRYSHRTGKSELCILATRFLSPGTVITELKGSMANLTEEEDRELKRTNTDIRRDFSVIHSKSMKKNHLFLGPARFVNHDCENNCELFREGKYITFRVLKPIRIGEEITAHYGDGYFGRRNRHCLCETCERNGRGGYAPQNSDDEMTSSDSSSDEDSSGSASDTSSDDEDPEPKTVQPLNLDERRTRRGVYAVVRKKQPKVEEVEEAIQTPRRGQIELTAEHDTPSELTAPGSELTSLSRSSSAQSPLSSRSSNQPTPYRSIISTRRQKAVPGRPTSQLITPPLSEDAALSTPTKGKGKASALSTPRKPQVEEVRVKEEEVEPRLPRLKETQNDNSCSQPKNTGPDGKLLPTCATCSNLLPVISVNSRVVWSDSDSSSKKKKNKEECPRCIRHFSVYGQPWPRRIPLPGSVSFLPTPRQESTPESPSKRVSRKALSALDRKLTAAKYGRPTNASKEERPLKKCKVESASAPVRASKSMRGRPPITVGPDGSPVKRRRGRPRLSSLPLMNVKQEELPPPSLKEKPHTLTSKSDKKALSFSPQKSSPQKSSPQKSSPQKSSPRSGPPLSRAERATEREKHKALLEKEEPKPEPPVKTKKRPIEEPDVFNDRPRKLLKVLPRPLGFRASRLYSNPTPLSFAVQAWAPPLIPDSDVSDSDESGPITPEDHRSGSVSMPKHLDPTAVLSASIAALTVKPSPFNFAKRRWSALSSITNSTQSNVGLDSLDLWTAAQDAEDTTLLSSEPDNDFHLQCAYPPFSDGALRVKKSALFSSLQASSPSLVDAGWDSCSEAADS